MHHADWWSLLKIVKLFYYTILEKANEVVTALSSKPDLAKNMIKHNQRRKQNLLLLEALSRGPLANYFIMTLLRRLLAVYVH